jgi:hypothetical protein
VYCKYCKVEEEDDGRENSTGVMTVDEEYGKFRVVRGIMMGIKGSKCGEKWVNGPDLVTLAMTNRHPKRETRCIPG